jgi:hypothetical protein
LGQALTCQCHCELVLTQVLVRTWLGRTLTRDKDPLSHRTRDKDPLTPYRVLLDVRRWSRAYTRQAGSGACTREERSLGHGSSTSSQCESREGRRGGNTARCSEEMRQNLAALSGSPAWPGSVQYSEARPPSIASSHTTAPPPPPFIYLSNHHPPVVLLLFACKLLCCCYSATPACLRPEEKTKSLFFSKK